jgi:mono/diheme cytochrome c family protein
MTLRLGLLAVLLAAGCRGQYIRPVSDEPIAATPERLQRGSYLVNQVTFCGACHTARAGGNILTEPESKDAFLGGGNVYNDKGFGTLWIPNITPDPETGIGKWKDDQILRLLRDGVAPDRNFMVPVMPFAYYQHLSDEDARSVVAYLRSVPPYHQQRPRQERKLGFMQKMMFGWSACRCTSRSRASRPPIARTRSTTAITWRASRCAGTVIRCRTRGRAPRPTRWPTRAATCLSRTRGWARCMLPI